jgi:hypothetical protein
VFNFATIDEYAVTAEFSGASVGSFMPVHFTLYLSGGPGALSSDVLPLTPPSPAAFDSRHVFLSFFDGQNLAFIEAEVTSLALRRVPEPATWVLLGTGVVTLLGWRRVKKPR